MNNHLQGRLQGIGLNESESKVYLYLLEFGMSNPPEISRNTGITRSNLHYILQNLVVKEIISRHQRGKRYSYTPINPKSTLHILDKKRVAMEEALEELEVLYKSAKQKPSIRFYEGSEEIKQIFEDILNSKEKDVAGFASTKRLFEVVSDTYMKYFGKEMYKRRIFLRDILSTSSAGSAAKSAERIGAYYKHRFVSDKEGGDFPTDILVWDDCVAIIVFEPQVFATVIENKPLADTYRLQFNIMWKALANR